MNIFITVLVILLQFVAGQAFGFGTAVALGVGNGWELVIIPLGNTVGVWGVGALAAVARKTYTARTYRMKLAGTAVGAALGAIIILVTPATGFGQLLYPLLAAIVGFYAAPRLVSQL